MNFIPPLLIEYNGGNDMDNNKDVIEKANS